jgi:hypothetical protein
MQFKAMSLISSDPDTHVKKLKAIAQLGPTAIVVMNISGSDPLGMLRTYGEHVLPQLRAEAWVSSRGRTRLAAAGMTRWRAAARVTVGAALPGGVLGAAAR